MGPVRPRHPAAALENDCPIPNAHRRLLQTHALWHQTLDSYADPGLFVVNLNARIQSLRNVTFVLQKEKHGVPDFSEWYTRWQRLMASSTLNQRWLKTVLIGAPIVLVVLQIVSMVLWHRWSGFDMAGIHAKTTCPQQADGACPPHYGRRRARQ